MKTKLKERPHDPANDSCTLPGNTVAVEMVFRVTLGDTKKTITEAEYKGLLADGTDDRVAEFGGLDDVYLSHFYSADAEAWRKAFPEFPRLPPDKNARCYTALTLFLYCAPEDTEAAHNLILRKWKIGPVTLVPTIVGYAPAAWVSRHDPLEFSEEARAVPRERIAKLTEIAEIVGGNVAMLAKLTGRRATGQETPFFVPGLIPKGNVTLLAAERKVGKSTLLLELCVTQAQGGGQWCGFDVPAEACNGLAVYLPGEDTGEVHARIAAMDPLERVNGRLLVMERNGRPLVDRLAELDDLRVSLLVVDPARAFLTGDEDNSDPANTFFQVIETFAAKHGCAAVVAHHLKKDASPRTVHDIPGCVRGTGVFLDRPRVVLGMIRTGEETLLGICAPNGNPLHNFRQSIMFAGQRRLRRDEATMRHRPVEAEETSDRETMSRVMSAVRRMNAEGRRVTRTGRFGIFEMKPEEIAGVSRQKIRAATDALIDAGELKDAGEGELVTSAGVT